MKFSREGICRICFGVLIAVGVGFLFQGLIVVPTLPYFQLDRVLSPADLADEEKHDATLSLLKKAAGNEWQVWVAGGLVVTCVSATGLMAAWQPGHQKKASDGVSDEL